MLVGQHRNRESPYGAQEKGQQILAGMLAHHFQLLTTERLRPARWFRARLSLHAHGIPQHHFVLQGEAKRPMQDCGIERN